MKIHPFAGFEKVGLTFLIISILSTVLFLITSTFPTLVNALSLSSEHPWGIFTSIFVHEDLSHLLNNIFSLSVFSAFFVLVNSLWKEELRRYWSTVFFQTIFLSGIGTNTVEFVLRRYTWSTISSCGVSAVVYASKGILMIASLYNFSVYLIGFSRFSKKRDIAGIFVIFLSIMIISSFLFELIWDPKTFFGAAPHVNTFAHFVGFLLGMAISSSILFIHNLRRVSHAGMV